MHLQKQCSTIFSRQHTIVISEPHYRRGENMRTTELNIDEETGAERADGPAPLGVLARGRVAAALSAARAAGTASRLLGRGGGTSLPGLLVERLAPAALPHLADQLARGSVLVAGTNGKTTTARMIAAVVEASGLRTVHNSAGANLLRGVASALAAVATPWGNVPRDSYDLGLFEVDEAALPGVISTVRPRVVLAMNLFRDQLDRYGELDAIASSWRRALQALPIGAHVLLNADDPLIASLGADLPCRVTYYGVEDISAGKGALHHAADSIMCLQCGEALHYSVVFYGHLGHYHCPHCGLTRPRPAVRATMVRAMGFGGTEIALQGAGDSSQAEIRFHLPLPGVYNAYNALAAATMATTLGLPLEMATTVLAGVTAAFGRSEVARVGDRLVHLLLIKNPVGGNEVLRLLADEAAVRGEPLHVLAMLNDNAADGHDVSWIWDVDVDVLAGKVARVVFGGTRAEDMALRFKYGDVIDPRGAGVPWGIERVVATALDAALAGCAPTGTLYAVVTYTAMLALRAELAARGHLRPYWEAS